MTLTVGSLLIMVIIAAIVGLVGELVARRRSPYGIGGAIILGFIAILLVTGIFHWSISGEPYLNNVPVITSVLVAALLVFLWSAFAYRRASGYASRYYRRRGTYARRPRRW